MIASDLCKPHYQNLLIIYLEFIAKNVERKTADLDVISKGLKITKFLIGLVSVRKNYLKPINGLIKIFPNTYLEDNTDEDYINAQKVFEE